MNLGLKDKSVIIMASSSGLGKAIATEFALEGANIMLFSTNKEKLLKTKNEIYEATGNEPLFTVGDITNYEDIKRLIVNTVNAYGGVYALVNNSGGPPAGNFEKFDDEIWQKSFELTLLSYIRTIREVLPYMKKGGGGRIINSTSSSIKQVLDNLILSNTFRMGVVGLSKSLSQELGKYDILVNVIAPGRIGTDRIDYLDNLRAEKLGISVSDLQEKTYKSIPLGRYGTPDEYGKLAVFLCSKANTYITGQTVLLDGGLTKAY